MKSVRRSSTAVNALAVMILTLFAASCSEDRIDYDSGTGTIALSLTVDPTITVAGPDGDYMSTLTELPSVSDFNVTLTDRSGEYSHTWPSASMFSSTEPYRSGEYTLTALSGVIGADRFSGPVFMASTGLTVTSGHVTPVNLMCKVATAMVAVDYGDGVKEGYPDFVTELQPFGGEYVAFEVGESRTASLRPGRVGVTVALTMPSGERLRFQPVTTTEFLPGYLYRISVDVVTRPASGTDPVIKIVYYSGGECYDEEIVLTDALIHSEGPEVIPEGFTTDKTVSLPEGSTPSSPLKMNVTSPGGIASAMLTINSMSLRGLPTGIDLVTATEAELDRLRSAGFNVSGFTAGAQSATIDFTDVVAGIRYEPMYPTSKFTLVVKDRMMRVNEPVSLTVVTSPVGIAVESVSPAVVGVNMAEVTVACHDGDPKSGLAIELLGANGGWTAAVITDVVDLGSGRYRVKFKVPDGTEPLEARIVYLGEVKDSFSITRRSPAFSIDVDAFARQARVRVIPKEDDMLGIITSLVEVYANGRRLSVLDRDTSTGYLTVIGLESSTLYNINASVMGNPGKGDFTEEVRITTERDSPLPNGDFEEIKESIKYEDMLSGGRYSQNNVEIFNRQNLTDVKVSLPLKGWATTNAKTFSMASKNQNTWYMQPSAMITTDAQSGGYAMELRSVAYDLNGPEIPDYVQPQPPFIGYSLNIPPIAHRAAGRLFLGEYSFTPSAMTESYNQGIAFASRPSALNGFYKYAPSANAGGDHALVILEVTGMVDGVSTVIASGRLLLPVTTDYTAFSLPLTYSRFGVKATGLKVMFASSSSIGTIDYESSAVKTVDDPVTATSIGSRLLIDNLSLAY